MSTKHTPGPWFVYESDDYKSRPGIEFETCSIVVFGSLEDQYDDCGVFGRTSEEGLANARLITAAPDLLQELSALLEMFLERQPCKGLDMEAQTRVDAARAAISKATGSDE